MSFEKWSKDTLNAICERGQHSTAMVDHIRACYDEITRLQEIVEKDREKVKSAVKVLHETNPRIDHDFIDFIGTHHENCPKCAVNSALASLRQVEGKTS